MHRQSTPSFGRLRVIAYIVFVILALFVVRLFFIQVIDHDKYVAEANAEQVKKFSLHAKRGEIYLMDGDRPTKVVLNQTVYTVWADPVLVDDKTAVVDALKEIAGGNTRKDFAKYLDIKDSRYQVLATKVTYRQAEMLKQKNLAGVGFDAVYERVYPEGKLASQVLGFVDSEGDGVYGFEQANDDKIRGEDGMLQTVTDVRDVPLTIGDKNIERPAVDGTNFVLSIDRSIQSKVEQALAAGIKRSGATDASAIVIDPRTGKVLAMANYPTFDPNHLGKVKDFAVLNNDVISAPYEPASVMKVFALAAGIDKGSVTPSTKFHNTGSVRVDDIVINNATKADFLNGDQTMQMALDWSLNTGMVALAKKLGDGEHINRQSRDTIYDYFHNRLGLGETTGIELAYEARGVLVSPDKLQGNAVRYSNMVFGQGLDVTMVQVAGGFSAMLNGGIYRAPTVIAGIVDGDGVFQSADTQSGSRVLKESTSRTLTEMIHKAHYATYKPQNEQAGFYIGGKTGTAQAVVDGKYVFDQTIGSYLGFGGEVGEIPSYVIMTRISAKGHNFDGGSDAKPIFNDISDFMINYLKLSPKR